jgi:hypothetical protein
MMKIDAGEWSSARDLPGSAQIRKRHLSPALPAPGDGTWMKSNARGVRIVQSQLDPFQVLLEYARKERHWQPLGSGHETTQGAEAPGTLKEEERKVKARTQSASRKEANVAVEAERARTERARLDTIEIAREVAVFARRIEALQTRGPRKDPRTPEEGSNHGRS